MITWRKSSYSGGGGDGGQECVEIARLPEGVGLRDSKAPEAGHLMLSAAALAQVIARITRDEADPS